MSHSPVITIICHSDVLASHANYMTVSFIYIYINELSFFLSCFQVLGTPSEESWPGVNSLPHFKPGETLKLLKLLYTKLFYVNVLVVHLL